MTGFLQPNPMVLALLSLQTFFYLPILGILAATRVGSAQGPARWLAAVALAVALIGMAAHSGPPLLKIYTGPLPQIASMLTKSAGGMALPLLASMPLLASGVAAGRRWNWIDWLHGLLSLGLVGLWGWTRVV